MHCSRIDRVLFAISSRRLLIFCSTDYGDLELPRHLRRDVNTFTTAHLREDAVVGTESARRVDFARVDGRVRGSSWDPYGVRVHM